MFDKEAKVILSSHTNSIYTFTCIHNNFDVAKAHIEVSNDIGLLADIIVAEYEVSVFRALPFIKKTVSYRRRGYGTFLLENVISGCRELKLKKIIGEINGNESFLKDWYSRFGFTIEGKTIYMHL